MEPHIVSFEARDNFGRRCEVWSVKLSEVESSFLSGCYLEQWYILLYMWEKLEFIEKKKGAQSRVWADKCSSLAEITFILLG